MKNDHIYRSKSKNGRTPEGISEEIDLHTFYLFSHSFFQNSLTGNELLSFQIWAASNAFINDSICVRGNYGHTCSTPVTVNEEEIGKTLSMPEVQQMMKGIKG